MTCWLASTVQLIQITPLPLILQGKQLNAITMYIFYIKGISPSALTDIQNDYSDVHKQLVSGKVAKAETLMVM